MMRKNKKLITSLLSVLAFCTIAVGVGISNNVVVSADVVEDASVISMIDAQVRTLDTEKLADTDPAIRFAALLSADAVDAIQNDGAKAGMMIFPDSYMDKYEAQTAEKDYCTFFEDSAHFRFTYDAEHLAYEESTGKYYIRASLGEIQFDNLDREFIAIAYVQYSDGSVVYAPVDRSYAKSVEQIASSALNNGKSYSIIVNEEEKTPLIEWLNLATYKKSGLVTYDKVDSGKNFVYNDTRYTYEELQDALSINTVVEDVYALDDVDFNWVYAGESHALQTENLADLDVQYSVEGNATITQDGVVTVNGDITEEQTVVVTARVGNNDAGNFFGGDNQLGMPVIKSTLKVKPIGVEPLSEMKEQNGVVYDWDSTYMSIGNQQGYRAQRKSLADLDDDVQTALFSHSSSDIVMNITGQGDNWLYGLTNTHGNLAREETTVNGVPSHNVYTIEFWYYSEYETKASFIAMDDGTPVQGMSHNNKVMSVMDFKKGVHKMTLEYESLLPNDNHFVLNFFTQAQTNVYLADMTVRCMQRADTRTDYYAPTDAEMMADGGYTWDFTNNNLLEISRNASYEMLAYMQNSAEEIKLRGELINDTRAFGNYGLHLSGTGGSFISFLTDNLKVDASGNGYIYDITFDAYRVKGGHLVLIPYDTANGQEGRKHLEFDITALGNGMYRYKTWVQASTDFNSLDLYGINEYDLYVSNFNIQMREPMSEEVLSGTLYSTDIDAAGLNQGSLTKQRIPGFPEVGDGTQWAYTLTNRTIYGNTDDVTLDLYEFALANNGYRFKNISVTIFYYVEGATESTVFVSHDGQNKSAGKMTTNATGKYTQTFTWGYNTGMLDLRYLGIGKSTGGSFGRIHIGSISYEITVLRGETETARTVDYTMQTTTSNTPETSGYSTYAATTAITENATVTSSGSTLNLALGADNAGIFLEVPSSQFATGETVHFSFDMLPDSTVINGYSPLQLLDNNGKLLDWAYPAGTTSKVNLETTVVSKDAKKYVYIGLHEAAGINLSISNIKIDKDLVPTGNELFGGTKLMQLENQSLRQMQSNIIKTWDGEVLVIDGGEQADAVELARQIRANVTPETQADGGVMYWVDALFITHYHVDHIGAALNMLMNRHLYGDIGFKNVYYDFEGAPGNTTSNEWTVYGRVFDEYVKWGTGAGAGKYTGAETDTNVIYADVSWQNRYGACIKNIISPKTGVIYTTKNGAVTIKSLNRAKFDCANNPENNSTVVYKMETYNANDVQKESVLFLGDLGDYGDTLMQDANFLAEMRTCRVVQMAHHGQGGTSKAFYQAIDDIRICLYPAPDWLFDVYDSNSWHAGLGDINLIGTAGYATLTTRAWMREMGVRYSYTMADGLVVLG